MLIAIGAAKLIITNICIQSGWRGGCYFPMIFSSISIGYGISMLTGTEAVFTIAMITASLLGFIMKNPVIVTILLLLFFPAKYIAGVILLSCAGTLVGKITISMHNKRIEA